MLRYLWRSILAKRVTAAVTKRSGIDRLRQSVEEMEVILAQHGRDLAEQKRTLDEVSSNIASLQDRNRLAEEAEPETSQSIHLLSREMDAIRASFETLNIHIVKIEEAKIELNARINAAMAVRNPTFFIPNLKIHPATTERFMQYSTCSARDFLHHDFIEICDFAKIPLVFHRKYWEWVFIVHHLRSRGMLTKGRRGLVFGVGTESLPSAFASLGADIMATDAPAEIGLEAGWQQSNQFSKSLEDLYQPSIVSREAFDKHVQFSVCDMNAIGPSFSDYDFCWSSCCFEHLGSLRKGLDFVKNSVEKTLRVGGVACHTTELNVSSEEDTIETGLTVLYRRKDIAAFVEEMRGRGHIVEEFTIAPDTHFLDFHADVPPYSHNPHLKLQLMGHVTTSVGLIIRRGR